MTDKMKKLAHALAQEGLNNNLCVEITVHPLIMQKLGDAEVQEVIQECLKSFQKNGNPFDSCPLTPRKSWWWNIYA